MYFVEETKPVLVYCIIIYIHINYYVALEYIDYNGAEVYILKNKQEVIRKFLYILPSMVFILSILTNYYTWLYYKVKL